MFQENVDFRKFHGDYPPVQISLWTKSVFLANLRLRRHQVRTLVSRPMLPFARVAFIGLLCVLPQARGQQPEPAGAKPNTASDNWAFDPSYSRFSFSAPVNLMAPLQNYQREFVRPQLSSALLTKPPHISAPDTIERMEAAFSCNDTPFIDQVRLPVAALWHGRVRLTGFESDITTANFVLGLPGAGTLANLSLTGSGHLAIHAPPSDQLVGMHLTFSIGSEGAGALDNSGLHGLQYLARTGRSFFQTLLIR